MLPLALFFLLVFLFLLWQSWRQQRSAGLPGGRIVYTDTGAWQETPKPLYDPGLGLTGKPDYLVQTGSALIPVEIKTGKTPAEPYDSHIFQLAAYCLLVQKTQGQRPPYGLIHYPQATYRVDYTEALENSLLDLLAEMRRDERRQQVERSHQSPHLCARCGFASLCEEKLS